MSWSCFRLSHDPQRSPDPLFGDRAIGLSFHPNPHWGAVLLSIQWRTPTPGQRSRRRLVGRYYRSAEASVIAVRKTEVTEVTSAVFFDKRCGRNWLRPRERGNVIPRALAVLFNIFFDSRAAYRSAPHPIPPVARAGCGAVPTAHPPRVGGRAARWPCTRKDFAARYCSREDRPARANPQQYRAFVPRLGVPSFPHATNWRSQLRRVYRDVIA
jgi:hypothetical protein